MAERKNTNVRSNYAYIIQVFWTSDNNNPNLGSWHNTNWGSNDLKKCLSIAEKIAKSRGKNSKITKVRVLEHVIEIDCVVPNEVNSGNQSVNEVIVVPNEKSKNYYFSIYRNSRKFPQFAIVRKDYWNKHHHLDDTWNFYGDDGLQSVLPDCFEEAMESVVSPKTPMTTSQAVKILKEFGLEQIDVRI